MFHPEGTIGLRPNRDCCQIQKYKADRNKDNFSVHG